MIAYSSEIDLVHDVYVRPFPGPGGQRRITTEGDIVWPEWSGTAHELLFLSLRSSPAKVMFTPYSVVGDSFRADKVQHWSPTNVLGHPFALHPDGKRMALVTAPAPAQPGIVQDKVVFVFNFFDYLRKIAPAIQ